MEKMPLKMPIPEKFDAREFIRWFELTSKARAPRVGDNLLEEGFKKALAGTEFNPFLIAIVAAVRTKWFVALTNETDIYGFGFGGSIYDQTVMAVSRLQDFACVEDLPSLTDTQKWQVRELYGKFVTFTERFPEVPTQPPAPVPVPVPAPAPRPVPVPEPIPVPVPKPEDPKPVPPAKVGWKTTLAGVVAIMGAVGWAVKMFLPSWADQAWDTIVAIATALAGG
jgi:hypothetical protein